MDHAMANPSRNKSYSGISYSAINIINTAAAVDLITATPLDPLVGMIWNYMIVIFNMFI
jgi:hypothetical protein